MRESEYMLVSGLARLSVAAQALGGILFDLTGERQKTVKESLKKIQKVIDEIYAELDGKIEEDPE